MKANEIETPHVESAEVGLRHQSLKSAVRRKFYNRWLFYKKPAMEVMARRRKRLPIKIDRDQVLDGMAQKCHPVGINRRISLRSKMAMKDSFSDWKQAWLGSGGRKWIMINIEKHIVTQQSAELVMQR